VPLALAVLRQRGEVRERSGVALSLPARVNSVGQALRGNSQLAPQYSSLGLYETKTL
jgi:hypothetical protein